MAVVFFCLVWLPCLLWFRLCASSLEVVTFSLAPSRGPLGWPGFRWLPPGLACLFCFGVPPVFPAQSNWGQFRSKFTHALQSWVTVTATLELKDSQSADVEVACCQLLGRKSFQFCLHLLGLHPLRYSKFMQQCKNIFLEGWLLRTQTKQSVETVRAKTKF